MHRSTLAALCLTAVTVAGVAGCQSGDSEPSGRAAEKTAGKTADKTAAKPKDPFAGLTASEIAERSLTATSGASSLRMTGNVPDDESGDDPDRHGPRQAGRLRRDDEHEP